MKLVTVRYSPTLLSALIGSAIGFSILSVYWVSMPNVAQNEQMEMTESIVQNEKINSKISSDGAKIQIHTVQDGESLSTIAQQYKIDVDTLRGANDTLGTDIYTGDRLIILPMKGVLHTTSIGDSLWHIADLYGVDVQSIMSANAKSNEQLSIGEKLLIPGAKKPQLSEHHVARTETPVSRSIGERFIWPTTGELTSGFGYRWGRLHSGIDLANDVGTQIRAARSGRVIHAGWYSGYGTTVVIEHEQGYITLYGHLSEAIVQDGQYIKGGQPIAYMGSTGNSTGPHLHFEVRKNGVPINPYSILP